MEVTNHWSSNNPAGTVVYDGYYALAYAVITGSYTDDAIKAILGYRPGKPGKKPGRKLKDVNESMQPVRQEDTRGNAM